METTYVPIETPLQSAIGNNPFSVGIKISLKLINGNTT